MIKLVVLIAIIALLILVIPNNFTGMTGGLPGTITCDSCLDCSNKIQSASSGETVILNGSINGSGFCIEFAGVDNIAFDCNGNSISCSGGFCEKGGIILSQSNNNTVKNCNVKGFRYGFRLLHSNGNRLINLTLEENTYYDFDIATSDESHCNNNLTSITGSGGRPIEFYSYTANIQDKTLSELVLCNADFSNVTNVTITGSATLKNNQFLIHITNNATISDIRSIDNYYGINMTGSNSSTITNVTLSNNFIGISIGNIPYDSLYNTISDSRIENNSYLGIVGVGDRSFYNLFYNNLFNNTDNAYIAYGTENYWNTTLKCSADPNIIGGECIGGNYWAIPEGKGFSENCSDSNSDGICDFPYSFSPNNFDYHPLTFGVIGTTSLGDVDGDGIEDTLVNTGVVGKGNFTHTNILPVVTGEYRIDTDLNSDGDKNDQILRYYDISTKSLVNTGVISSSGSIRSGGVYKDVIVFTCYESNLVLRYYNMTSGSVKDIYIGIWKPYYLWGKLCFRDNIVPFFDYNNTLLYYDIDKDSVIDAGKEVKYILCAHNGKIAYTNMNDTLMYYDTDAGSETSTGLLVTDKKEIWHGDIYGDSIVFLNKSGVAKHYDIHTGEISTIPLPLNHDHADVNIYENLIVAKIKESELPADLNNDGDLLDPIIVGYDLESGEMINTGITPYGATNILYKNIIAFASDEHEVGSDLNGDGYVEFYVGSIFVLRYINLSKYSGEPACGNNICESDETYSNCCIDCPCPAGKKCQNNVCVEETVTPPGGGPAGEPSEEPEEPKPSPNISKKIEKIIPGEVANITIEREEIGFSEIHIEVKNPVNNIEVTITKVPDKPTEVVHTVSGKVYQYINVIHENITETDIEKATIGFRVSKTWIKEKKVNKSTVALNRYTNKWEKLPTILIGESPTFVYYEAEVPGLSVFAITGEEEVTSIQKLCIPEERVCFQGEVLECNTEGTEYRKIETCEYGCSEGECRGAPEIPVKIKFENWLWMIVIAVVIIVAIAGFVINKKRHKLKLEKIPSEPPMVPE